METEGTKAVTSQTKGDAMSYLPSDFKVLEAKLQTAERQNKELLAALKTALHYLPDDVPAPALYEIEDVIAKAKA